jgi:8-oxo-dGTP pyrophosphatase MutT (NUDIX family)
MLVAMINKKTPSRKQAVIALIQHPMNPSLFLGVSRKTNPNDMGCVGGKMEGTKGETYRDALTREVMEETGLTVDMMTPIFRTKCVDYLVHTFLTTVLEDLSKPLEEVIHTSEAGVVRWTTREELEISCFADYNKVLFTSFVDSPRMIRCH